MKRIQRAAVLGLIAAAVLGGCAPSYRAPNYDYRPPSPKAALENQMVINADFDTTWAALVDYVSSTFFLIRNFEKESGLLTLAFGETNIPRFVDCGTWFVDGRPEAYIERDFDFKLSGQMNLRVRPVSSNRSDVRINTRYVLRDNSNNVYEFTTDSPATLKPKNWSTGTPPMRTCQSTHEAEERILTGIAAISSR